MKIFEPITIRNMELKNRIVMPAMQVRVGFGNRRAIDYWTERARGGVAAIIGSATTVDAFIFDEAWGPVGAVTSFLNRLRLLTREVHEAGAKMGAQLVHFNRLPLGLGMPAIGEPVGPSAGPRDPRPFDPIPATRELTREEIQFIISKFARAAAATKKAGFDFVEFYGAHGHLPCQFFSPLCNHRTDEYGSDLRGRMRFGLECIRAMRAAVGNDYPLFMRIGAEENSPGGITLSDSITFAKEVERAGVDVISVSNAEHEGCIPTTHSPMGTFAYLAHAIKLNVNVPVIAVGRINSPEVAEAIISEAKADLVAIGRQLIADPFWPKKAAEGRLKDIVPCLSCSTCRDSSLRFKGELLCSVNASVGRELDYRIKPAVKSKKVWVIGGGPAGMEAARVAALRGHQVTLWEKKERLGGQLLLAAKAPHKEVMREFADYLAGQIKKLGVQVRLNTEFLSELAAKANPDVVILATGAVPLVPDILGADGENVVTALDVLSGSREVEAKAIIVGGEQVSLDCAEFLAEKGKKVTITRRGPEMATKVGPTTRGCVLDRLRGKGITMLTGMSYDKINDKGLIVVTKEGIKKVLEADTIVMAAGATPENRLAEELKGKVDKLYIIGDCFEPRKTVDAINDGARVGREI